MTESDPTSDQRARDAVRTALDDTLFVEAGAGTGKTSELVARICALVCRGVRVTSIVAITFTESAAAELRDRVRQALERAVSHRTLPRQGDLPLTGRQVAYCERALREIDDAALLTLHSFSQRLLAEHALSAGLPPGFEILDEIEASRSFDDRFALLLDALLDDGAHSGMMSRALALGLSFDVVRDIARAFDDEWDRATPLAITEAAGDPPSVAIEEVLAPLEEAVAARALCLLPADRLAMHLSELEELVQWLRTAEHDLDHLRLLAGARKLSKRVGSKANWPEECPPQTIRDLLEEAEGARQDLLAGQWGAVLDQLIPILARFALEGAEQRRREGRVRFHDLLVRARNLVTDNADVREAVRGRYRCLLIDEFQDTDSLQLDLASRIAELDQTRDPGMRDGALFLVGDPKQSIYRFRRADIATYLDARQRLEAARVSLRANFRSSAGILRWLNDTFSELLCGEDGVQPDYEPLEPGRTEQQRPSSRPPVAYVGGPDEPDRVRAAADRRSESAATLVAALRTVREEGWPVEVGSPDGSVRTLPARFEDMAVLIPTRTALPALEQALDAAGVPYRVESRSLIYASQDVRDLVALLRAVSDPTDAVSVVAALRTPALASGDDDLVAYRHAGGSWDYRDDAPALAAGHPVVTACGALRELHEQSAWLTPAELAERVVHDLGLLELAFAYRRPRDHWRRVRLVVDQAHRVTEAGGTLRDLLAWLDRQAEEGAQAPGGVVPEPDDDAIRIMTVHAAKGLEFPVVALTGLDAPRGKVGGRVLWPSPGERPELQLGAHATAGWQGARDHEKRMAVAESDRLLYVAATRARDHLLLDLHHPGRAEGSNAEPCHAELLWRLVDRQREAGLLTVCELSDGSSPHDTGVGTVPDEDVDAWWEERRGRLEEARYVPAVAATAFARRMHEAMQADDATIGHAPIGGVAEHDDDESGRHAPARPFGRAGTAVGRAVHACLQVVDLAAGDAVRTAALADVHAAREGVARMGGEVRGRVASALSSTAVARARQAERHWRELYVGVELDGVLLEGFIDLMYETPDGLVIVDYKTDAVDGDRLDALLARYRWQGAAYAVAVEAAVSRPVVGCRFVFTEPSGPVERDLPDLGALTAEVRDRLPAVAGAP